MKQFFNFVLTHWKLNPLSAVWLAMSVGFLCYIPFMPGDSFTHNVSYVFISFCLITYFWAILTKYDKWLK